MANHEIAMAAADLTALPVIALTQTLAEDTEDQGVKAAITIEIPPASAADNEALTEALAVVVNAAYDEAEAGIFKPGYSRTCARDLAALIRAGELAVAFFPASQQRQQQQALDVSDGRSKRAPVGCISMRRVGPVRGELGMFAVGAAQRGTGVGRELLTFAEHWCRERFGGEEAVAQLELLVPTHFESAFKTRIGAWYARAGYVLVGCRDFAADYPRLAPLLAGPTEYRVMEKRLV
ncbi:hypothetical protein AAE478_001519 [Parahypoxylon ruwenzoriense]